MVADALVMWYCSWCYNLVLLIFSGLNVSLLVLIILFLDEYKVQTFKKNDVLPRTFLNSGRLTEKHYYECISVINVKVLHGLPLEK